MPHDRLVFAQGERVWGFGNGPLPCLCKRSAVVTADAPPHRSNDDTGMRKRTSFTTRAIVALLGLGGVSRCGVLAVAARDGSSSPPDAPARSGIAAARGGSSGSELATSGGARRSPSCRTPRVKFEDVTLQRRRRRRSGGRRRAARPARLGGFFSQRPVTRVTDASLAQTRIAVQIGRRTARSPWDAPSGAAGWPVSPADYRPPRALAVESFGLRRSATLVYTDADQRASARSVRDADLTLLLGDAHPGGAGRIVGPPGGPSSVGEGERPPRKPDRIGESPAARLREVIQISLSGLSPGRRSNAAGTRRARSICGLRSRAGHSATRPPRPSPELGRDGTRQQSRGTGPAGLSLRKPARPPSGRLSVLRPGAAAAAGAVDRAR